MDRGFGERATFNVQRTTSRMAVFVMLAVLVDCGSAPEKREGITTHEMQGTEADYSAIENVRSQWAEALAAGDVDGILALFTDDAVQMSPNEPAIVGKDAQRARLAPAVDLVDASVEWDSEEVRVAGSWAYDLGTMIMDATPKAGAATQQVRGKYLMILERGDSAEWKVARFIYNSSEPPG